MYQLAVFLHVLGAAIWVGGIVFLVAVAVPVARRFDPETRARIVGEAGRQFRLIGWTTLGVMVVTGAYAASVRGATLQNVLDGTFWATTFGRTLAEKLVLVALMAVVSFVHDFYVGPASTRATAAGADTTRLRRTAAWLARLTGLLALGVLFLAVLLVRPGLGG
jgi:putative copper resistance protein D